MTSPPAGLERRLHPDPLPGRGSGTRLWLLRHAEVDAAWQGVAYGSLDVPLSPAGERRTLALAEAFGGLPVARLLASPLGRARALGEALGARLGLAPELSPALAEICRGSWQGRPVAELHAELAGDVRAFYADPWSWCGHGGESDAAVHARVVPLVEGLLAEGPPGRTVLLATHYNVIRVLAAACLGIPPERSFALRVDPGRALLLVDGPPGWQLFGSNLRGPGVDGEGDA